MENTFDDIDNLIGKYLAEEGTTEERALVEEWVARDTENKKYFDDLALLFAKASQVKNFPAFDTDEAWTKLKGKLNGSDTKTIRLTPPRQSSGLAFYYRIAAAILLVAAVATVIYLNIEKPAIETHTFAATTTTTQDTLPDGSSAFLNKGTSLAYQYNPKDKVRRARLDGEAYFEVKHEETKPFIIETGDVIIEDIGTTFNVKAYPGSPTVEVYVETGAVAFYTKENPGLQLNAGETGIYHRQSQSFARLIQQDSNVLAYKTRVFSFHNTDLGSIVESLNEVFDVKLRLSNPELEKCRINVSFKGEPIDVIADIIAETLELKLIKHDNEIVLEGERCME